jgi:hypothetical protein
MHASVCGGNLEIPPCLYWISNLFGGTLAGRQFDWGGRLLKSNGGAQRFSQPERKPGAECNGIRELDCETDGSSRWETRP